jgi:hypothetical protein
MPSKPPRAESASIHRSARFADTFFGPLSAF